MVDTRTLKMVSAGFAFVGLIFLLIGTFAPQIWGYKMSFGSVTTEISLGIFNSDPATTSLSDNPDKLLCRNGDTLTFNSPRTAAKIFAVVGLIGAFLAFACAALDIYKPMPILPKVAFVMAIIAFLGGLIAGAIAGGLYRDTEKCLFGSTEACGSSSNCSIGLRYGFYLQIIGSIIFLLAGLVEYSLLRGGSLLPASMSQAMM